MFDIQQIFSLYKAREVNYMIPFNCMIESFTQYVTRIQKTSKKTQWQRNSR